MIQLNVENLETGDKAKTYLPWPFDKQVNNPVAIEYAAYDMFVYMSHLRSKGWGDLCFELRFKDEYNDGRFYPGFKLTCKLMTSIIEYFMDPER